MAKGVKGSSPTEDVPVRTSYNIRPSITLKMKYIALVEKTNVTALQEQLFTDFIRRWEKKNGEIKI